MTFANFILPIIALLLLVPCLTISTQVGIAVRTLYQIWAAETLSRAGYPHCEIWRKSDTNNFLLWSTWFIGITSKLGCMWVLVMLEGLVLRIDVMSTLTEIASYGTEDKSLAWQVVAIMFLVTSVMTHGHLTAPVRGRALARANQPDTLQNT